MDASLITARQRVVFQRMNIDSPLEDLLAGLPYIEWDASENESHSYGSTVTEHPVERGTDVTDHVIHKPARLTLRLLQTNHPIYKNPNYDIGTDRVGQTFEALDQLRRYATPFEVVTSLKRYDDMLIESVDIERNAKTGQALSVTVQLKQVRFVANATVPDPRDQRARNGKKEGLKPTTPATAAQQEASFTVLNGLIGNTLKNFGADLRVGPQ